MTETYPVNASKSKVPWSLNQNPHKLLLIVLMVQVKGEVGLWCLWCLVSFWTPRRTDWDCWLGLLVRAEHCTVGLPHQTSLMLVSITPHSVNCYAAKIVESVVFASNQFMVGSDLWPTGWSIGLWTKVRIQLAALLLLPWEIIFSQKGLEVKLEHPYLTWWACQVSWVIYSFIMKGHVIWILTNMVM